MRRVLAADAERRFLGHHEKYQNKNQSKYRPDIADPPGQPRGASVFARACHRRQHRIVEDEAELHGEDRDGRETQRQHGECRVGFDKPQAGRRRGADDSGVEKEAFHCAAAVRQAAENRGGDGDQQRAGRCHPCPGGGAAIGHHRSGEKDGEDESCMKRRDG